MRQDARMKTQSSIDQALAQIAIDLATTMAGDVQFQRLVAAIANVLPCDAVALFQLHDETLIPVASEGLAPELIGRRFNPAEHPRLKAILRQRVPVRFAADSSLPDPFDGLLAIDPEREHAVHACMGCSLYVDEQLVGVLTLDAHDAQAFDDLPDSTVAAFAALSAATLRNVALIQDLKAARERQYAISRDLTREVYRQHGELVGNSPTMHSLRNDIRLVAATDLAVLITGETGTGKELVVRNLHAQSPRADQALVQVNCAALPESMAESELFGHKKGAFTGAVSDRAGKFELAHGGTLFLDEIGELPLMLQAKLLRALQQGEIQRVGADQVIKVNVRLIAATNRDLQAEVDACRFRPDLYHRLNVYPIHVPALREHSADIAVLAGHFLDAARLRLGIGQIDLHPEALAALQTYDWPGNVRELEHLMLRASLKAGRRGERTVLRASDLGLPVAGESGLVEASPVAAQEAQSIDLRSAVDLYQQQIITQNLKRHRGNWAQTARALNVDPANLQRLAKRLGVVNR